ncbi:MAG TPA: PP2C family protein-serine/threonine phosphatase [Candidatus Angelobacter sp.]|nr:PP2C family protein-serine/threonine phosphatase [Candidatus Angelobacter sp.]
MAGHQVEPSIDEYLRKRLMPVEGAIPQLVGIDMYGNSIPAGPVGGDLFEYINFQQRYNIDARIARSLTLSQEYLEPLLAGRNPRNSVDAHVEWLRSKPGYTDSTAAEYRRAKGSEQVRIAEYLQELHTTAGVLLVDAQGHGVISAKIASTVHDTFHAFMLAELDGNGRTTPDMFEKINLRLGQSVTARNALGLNGDDNSREIATMLYGEIRPSGHFRFINFGHPPPLVFSAEYEGFVEIGKASMAQFLPLGVAIPENNPDRNRYFSITPRTHQMDLPDVAEITLMSSGDILFLYTDGVYDGSDEEDRLEIEGVIRKHQDKTAREICNAILQHAVKQDERLVQTRQADRIDDKTAFIIKRG